MRSRIRTLFAIMLLLAATVASLFFLPLHNGKPLLTRHDIPAAIIALLPEQWRGPNGAMAPEMVTVYRWRDRDGVWHYGSAPPDDGSAYESRTVSTEANAALFPPLMQPAEQPRAGGAATTAQPTAPSPYSAEGLRKLFDDAHNIRDRHQQRRDAQDGQ
jgi:hypothetical protein